MNKLLRTSWPLAFELIYKGQKAIAHYSYRTDLWIYYHVQLLTDELSTEPAFIANAVKLKGVRNGTTNPPAVASLD